MAVHFVMMGVYGYSKTTAALALQGFSDDCPYAEGDEFHAQENRDEMGTGVPLIDENRYPWLCRLRGQITERPHGGVAYSVVTYSMLKRDCCDILYGAEGKVVPVCLTPPQEVNLQRMTARKGHYTEAGALGSQLEILEELDVDKYDVKIGNLGTPKKVGVDITAWMKKEGLTQDRI